MLKYWSHFASLIIGILSCLIFSENTIQSIGIFLLFISIVFSFTLNKNRVLVEPINFFSLFSFTIILVEIYFYHFGFYRNKYILATTFSQDLDILFTKAIYLILLGYWCVCLSYFLCRKKISTAIKPTSNINQKGLKYSIWIFAFLSVSNFAYIVYYFAGGDVLGYIRNVSLREYEYMSGGVTGIFLDFGVYALFFWIYYNYLYKKKFSIYFFVFLVFVVVMKYSQGRIFQTLGVLVSFYIIAYFMYFIHAKRLLMKQMLGMLILGIGALVLYAYRVRSSLMVTGKVDSDFSDQLAKFFQFEEFTYYLIEKGNVPNIPIFMKIIDSWRTDLGYLYGQSVLFPIYRFIPKAIQPENISISDMVKKEWYGAVEGGALPPTCFGEMYANGGIWGIVLGMLAFGVFMAVVYNSLQRFQNISYLVIYAIIVSSFFLIYPKGESDNLGLVGIFIFLLSYVFILVFSSLFYVRPKNNAT